MKLRVLETLIAASSIILSISSLSSAQSNPQSSTVLPTGVYYSVGSMFNNSRREIVHKNNRICIKIVNGPPHPYKGVEAITISSVSSQKGNFYVDATGEKLVLEKDGKVINSGRGGVWEYTGTTPDRRSKPIQAQKMAECVAAQGRYVQKMQGISIPGIDIPKR